MTAPFVFKQIIKYGVTEVVVTVNRLAVTTLCFCWELLVHLSTVLRAQLRGILAAERFLSRAVS